MSFYDKHNDTTLSGICNDKYADDVARGDLKINSQHGKVVSSGFGGAQWYEFADGTVRTYQDLMRERREFHKK